MATNKEYISSLINARGELYDFKHGEKKKEVPSITDEGLQIIKVMLAAVKAEKILEIGTATGASSMFFASCIGENAKITTIERDDAYFIRANNNISLTGYDSSVTVLHGDAKELLSELNEQYDLIFLDGAKAQYINLLPHCKRLLKKGGVLIADNVLFRGMVSGQTPLLRRKTTIVKRLRRFLEEITCDEDLITAVIDAGDGVSVSVKK